MRNALFTLVRRFRSRRFFNLARMPVGCVVFITLQSTQAGDDPIGACCIPSPGGDICADNTPRSICELLEGSFLGEGSTCQPGICENLPEVGACCVTAGGQTECAAGLSQKICESVDGVWLGAGTECDDDSCDAMGKGACFVPDQGCVIVTEKDCATHGGNFAGAGTNCGDFGPCFIDGQPCMEKTEAECQSQGGIWGGPNQTCDQSGACVLPDGTCYQRTETQCEQSHLGAQFYPGQACDTVGPCLFPDGTCGFRPSGNCTSGGGVPGSPNCACTDIDCICANDSGSPQCDPVGACRAFGDASVCLILRRSVCENQAGIFCGAGTSCDEPCDGEYACCWLELGIVFCEVMDARDCGEVGGTILPNVTSCDAADTCLGGQLPCDGYVLWTGGGGANNSILNPDNWKSGEAPTGSTQIAFELADIATVTIPSNASVGNMLVAQGGVSFVLNGSTLNLSDENTLCDDLIIGVFNGLTAALTIDGGLLNGTEILTMGAAPGATGNLTIGAGGSFRLIQKSRARAYVAFASGSAGRLIIESGGKFDAPSVEAMILGNQPLSSGTLIVRNAGSELDLAGVLLVGNGGAGTMEISDSARVDATIFQCGIMPGSTANISLAGGAVLNVEALNVIIGQHGTATMTVDASTVNSDEEHIDSLVIGQEPGSSGSVTLQNGATWHIENRKVTIAHRGSGTMSIAGSSTLNCSFLNVGVLGDGQLQIASGGTVACARRASVAQESGSEAEVFIDGTQSRLLVTSSPTDGIFDVGDKGSGAVSVSNGGSINCGPHMRLGAEFGGQAGLFVNGGLVDIDADLLIGGRAASELANTGLAMVQVSNEGVLLVNGEIHVRASAASAQYNELQIENPGGIIGAVTSEQLHVGVSGLVRVSNGGQLNTNFLAVIGGADGSFVNPARVETDGVGSRWTVDRARFGELQLGIPGEAVVSNGARLQAVLLEFGPEGTLSVSTDGRVDTGILNVNGGTITDPNGIFVGGAPLPLRRGGSDSGVFAQHLIVEVGATLDVPSIALRPGGTISGGGVIAFDLMNDGLVNPGGSEVGSLTVNGSYQQTVMGSLQIDLATGGASDSILVSGAAELAGTLIVKRSQCATVFADVPFVAVVASQITGTFSEVVAPPRTTANVEYTDTQVIVSLSKTVYNADCYNSDGVVDVHDLFTLLSRWGEQSQCDVDQSGEVDQNDLTLLLAEWGDCS